jgi:hypothetical protein
MRSKINAGGTTVHFNRIRIAEKGIFKVDSGSRQSQLTTILQPSL